MKKNLKLISERTKAGRHAVILVDGASWPQEHLTDDFPNITLIKLPAYSPELRNSAQGLD